VGKRGEKPPLIGRPRREKFKSDLESGVALRHLPLSKTTKEGGGGGGKREISKVPVTDREGTTVKVSGVISVGGGPRVRFGVNGC